MHETDADSWIQDNGTDLSVHFRGDRAASFQFIVNESANAPAICCVSGYLPIDCGGLTAAYHAVGHFQSWQDFPKNFANQVWGQ